MWRGTDEWRAEAADVEFVDGVRATGTQIGAAPGGYRLDYRLDATDGWRTRSLEIAIGDRRVRLERDDRDRWRSSTASRVPTSTMHRTATWRSHR